MQEYSTFGDHLEVMRRMLLRVLAVTAVFTIIIFSMKDEVFHLLLWPANPDFPLYDLLGIQPFSVTLITTELTSQFMTHITASCAMALLLTAPYILFELFHFISPALYDNERHYSRCGIIAVYLLFMLGVVLTYAVLFPVSLRFLATYSVAETVHATITLDSYISTLLSLTLMIGVVFQLPVVAFILAKMRVVTSALMSRYRHHALILLMLTSAVITPPDIMSLIIVTIPIYLLYELSIWVVKAAYE